MSLSFNSNGTSDTSEEMMTVPRPVLAAMSVLAALKVLAGAAVIGDLVGSTVTGVALIVVAAVEVGVAFYLQGQVVPMQSTVAYVRGDQVRAGGAAIQPNGSIVRPEVEVGRLTLASKE